MTDKEQDASSGGKASEGRAKRARGRPSRERKSKSGAPDLGAFGEAQHGFLLDVAEAWYPREDQQQLSEFANAYLASVWRSDGPDAEAARRAYDGYVTTVGRLLDPARVQKEYERALRDYADALKRAWAETVPEAIEPASLVWLGLAVASAAAVAGTVTEASTTAR